eukprot:g4058.t1
MPRYLPHASLALAVVLVRAGVAAGSCSAENCEACTSQNDCDMYECDSVNDLNGFRCLSSGGDGTDGGGCTEVSIDRCHEECEGEFSAFGVGQSEEDLEDCLNDCDRNCDQDGDGSGLDGASLLGAVAFMGIFACAGTSLISGSLTHHTLETRKRKYYRENGDKIQGIVVSKSTRTVSAGENGTRTSYDLTVDVQTEVNGQQLRASKPFPDISADIFTGVNQGGPIAVTSIAGLTGDPRHFMLSAYADSDTKGLTSRGCIVCFGGIFAGAGIGGSLGVSVGLILPEGLALGIIGVIFSLLCAIIPIPLAKSRVEKKFETEKQSPSGTRVAPRTAVEMANMQKMGQPIMLVQGAVAQQPVVVQQPVIVQQHVVVQQPVVSQQPGTMQVQPVGVMQQQMPNPAPVPVPV